MNPSSKASKNDAPKGQTLNNKVYTVPEKFKKQFEGKVPIIELQEIWDAFSLMDQDGTESLSISEMNAAFIALGLTSEASAISHLFKNKNVIDFPSFVKIVTQEDDSNLQDEKTLSDFFGLVDRDGKGSISENDIIELARSLDEHLDANQAKLMMDALSVHGKGQILPDDFAEIMLEGSVALEKQKRDALSKLTNKVNKF